MYSECNKFHGTRKGSSNAALSEPMNSYIHLYLRTCFLYMCTRDLPCSHAHMKHSHSVSFGQITFTQASGLYYVNHSSTHCLRYFIHVYSCLITASPRKKLLYSRTLFAFQHQESIISDFGNKNLEDLFRVASPLPLVLLLHLSLLNMNLEFESFPQTN